MHIQVELIDIVPVGNVLGEGVLWRKTDQTLWWTDIQQSKLYRLRWADHFVSTFDLPERLGSFGFVEGDSSCFVCAFETGFALYWPESEKIKWLDKPAELGKGRRLNDGRVSPEGHFWAGSMIETEQPGLTLPDTGIYRLSDSRAELLLSHIHVSNGISWSHCGKEMYFADSEKQRVYRSAPPTELTNASYQEAFIELQDGLPDGAVTDSEGRYWSAIWGQSCVRCYSANGNLLTEIAVPALQPTCMSFGGPFGDLLFVTSARQGLDDATLDHYPESGNLFIYQTNVQGIDSCFFKSYS